MGLWLRGFVAVLSHLHLFRAAEETLEIIPGFEAQRTEIHSLFSKDLPDDLFRIASIAEKDYLIAGDAPVDGTNEIKTSPPLL